MASAGLAARSILELLASQQVFAAATSCATAIASGEAVGSSSPPRQDILKGPHMALESAAALSARCAGPQCPRSAFRYDFMFCWLTGTMRRVRGKAIEIMDLCPPPNDDLIVGMLPDMTLRDMMRAEGFWLMQAGAAMLLDTICRTSLPVIMLMVILCVESVESAETEAGDDWLREWAGTESMIYWVLAYVVFQLTAALVNQWQLHISFHVGQRLRAKLVMMVFQKALRIDPLCRPSVGNTLTLMASDSQKFLEAMPLIHKLWASPLQILVTSLLLVSLVHASALCGIAALVVVIPISKNLAKRLQGFRRRHLEFMDQRVRMCVELLEGIRCIKFFAWEKPYLKRIFEQRCWETSWAMKESVVFSVSMMVTVLSPMLSFASTLIASYLLDGSTAFSAARLFGTLALLNALRFPIMTFGSMLTSLVALRTSWQRLRHFLDCAEAGIPLASIEDQELVLENCTFESAEGDCALEQKCFQLSLPTRLTVERGELVLVLGTVGSGKSTLLQGLLGEIGRAGLLAVRGAIAYCAQQPWIRNATVMDNIVFGEDMDSEWYGKVIDACGLRPDLQQLPHGDQTEIGERGVTISGGQKQRVALARAVYHRACALVVLDDVFSALDAHTASHIGKALFQGAEGLLRDRAVLMASHNTTCAAEAQRVFALGPKDSSTSKSTLLFDGDWLELRKQPSLLTLLGHAPSPDDESEKEEPHASQATAEPTVQSPCRTPKPKSMMRPEEQKNKVSWRAVKMYCQCCGGPRWVGAFLISSVLERLSLIFLDWWLARWAEEGSADDHPMYFAVYGALVLGVIAFVALSRLILAVATVRGARRLFEQLAVSVVRAPMWWWDTTPLGRVLNRFGFDTENADTTLCTMLFPALMSLSWCLGAIGVMAVALWPYSLLIIPVLVVGYAFLFQFAHQSIRQFQQMDSMSRSPIQSLYSEVLHGIVSVRAFALEQRYISCLAESLNINSAAVLTANTSKRWLGVRVELLAALVSGLVGIGCWLLRQEISAGVVGLCFIWATNLSNALGFNSMFFSQAEAVFTSVERIVEFASEVPSEGVHEGLDSWRGPGVLASPENRKAAEWEPDKPDKPLLSFESVSLRYQSTLPLALDSISFEVAAFHRVAVVGRTGSGKSTLAAALFRLSPLESGRVCLKGVDLASLPLDVARKRIGIITQDPVIFSGTVRYNLDPFGEFDAADCAKALSQAQLAGTLALGTQIQQAGSNVSIGERQLLCLARALLRKPSLLVCDEATSSVDALTDAHVQACLRVVASSGTALLSIAHRLATIADYDKVMVLRAGQVVELGSPATLLRDPASEFSSLVDSLSTQEAAAIRSIAMTAPCAKEVCPNHSL